MTRVHVRARVATSLRSIDLVARYGGEEFMVAMPDTDFETAQAVAERLRAQVAEAPFAIPGEDAAVTVTASIGIAVSGTAKNNVSALVKRADEGLYAAKQGGRNRVMCVAA